MKHNDNKNVLDSQTIRNEDTRPKSTWHTKRNAKNGSNKNNSIKFYRMSGGRGNCISANKLHRNIIFMMIAVFMATLLFLCVPYATYNDTVDAYYSGADSTKASWTSSTNLYVGTDEDGNILFSKTVLDQLAVAGGWDDAAAMEKAALEKDYDATQFKINPTTNALMTNGMQIKFGTYTSGTTTATLYWTPTYLTSATMEDGSTHAVLDLWVADNIGDGTISDFQVNHNGGWNNGVYRYDYGYITWTSGDLTLNYPSSMYSSSVARSLLNGTGYAMSATNNNLTTAGVQKSIWSDFLSEMGYNAAKGTCKFLVQPKYVSYQANEKVTDYKDLSALVGNNLLLNEAYNVIEDFNVTVTKDVQVTGGDGQVTTEQQEVEQSAWVSEDFYNVQNKYSYTDWQNDYLWLPSLTEVGAYSTTTSKVATGLWNLKYAQLYTISSQKVNYNTWNSFNVVLRSTNSATTYAGLAGGVYGASNPLLIHDYGQSYTSYRYYVVKPAIHLDLTEALNSTQAEVELPEDYHITYDAQNHTLRDLFNENKPEWYNDAYMQIDEWTISYIDAGSYKITVKIVRNNYTWKEGTNKVGEYEATFNLVIDPKPLMVKVDHDKNDKRMWYYCDTSGNKVTTRTDDGVQIYARDVQQGVYLKWRYSTTSTGTYSDDQVDKTDATLYAKLELYVPDGVNNNYTLKYFKLGYTAYKWEPQDVAVPTLYLNELASKEYTTEKITLDGDSVPNTTFKFVNFNKKYMDVNVHSTTEEAGEIQTDAADKVSFGNGVTFYKGSGTLSVTNSGTYTVVFTLRNDTDKDYDIYQWQDTDHSNAIEITVKVTKKAVELPTCTNANQEYNEGNELEFTVKTKSDDGWKVFGYDSTKGNEATVAAYTGLQTTNGLTIKSISGKTLTAAASATGQYYLDVEIDTTNYTWADGTDTAVRRIPLAVAGQKIARPTLSSDTIDTYTYEYGTDGNGIERTFTIVGSDWSCYDYQVYASSDTLVGSYSFTTDTNNVRNMILKATKSGVYTVAISPAKEMVETSADEDASAATGTDAAEYTYKYCWATGGSIYETIYFEFTINKIQVEKPTIKGGESNAKKEYANGADIDFTLTYDNWKLVNINKPDTLTMSEIPASGMGDITFTAKDIGNYLVSMLLKDAENMEWADNDGKEAADYNLRITPIIIQYPTESANTVEYNGKDQTYTLTSTQWDLLGSSGEDTKDGNVVSITRKEVGKYYIKVGLKDTTKYMWPDETQGVKTFEFRITKKGYEAPTFFQGMSTTEYTGGEIVFRLYSVDGWDNVKITTSMATEESQKDKGIMIFKGMGVGDYEVTLSFTDDDHYYWENAAEGTLSLNYKFSITKRKLALDIVNETKPGWSWTAKVTDVVLNAQLTPVTTGDTIVTDLDELPLNIYFNANGDTVYATKGTDGKYHIKDFTTLGVYYLEAALGGDDTNFEIVSYKHKEFLVRDSKLTDAIIEEAFSYPAAWVYTNQKINNGKETEFDADSSELQHNGYEYVVSPYTKALAGEGLILNTDYNEDGFVNGVKTVDKDGNVVTGAKDIGEYTTYMYILPDPDDPDVEFLATKNIFSFDWSIAKLKFDLSNVTWTSGPFEYSIFGNTVTISGLPAGLEVETYSGNKATEIGTYTAKVVKFKITDESLVNSYILPDPTDANTFIGGEELLTYNWEIIVNNMGVTWVENGGMGSPNGGMGGFGGNTVPRLDGDEGQINYTYYLSDENGTFNPNNKIDESELDFSQGSYHYYYVKAEIKEGEEGNYTLANSSDNPHYFKLGGNKTAVKVSITNLPADGLVKYTGEEFVPELKTEGLDASNFNVSVYAGKFTEMQVIGPNSVNTTTPVEMGDYTLLVTFKDIQTAEDYYIDGNYLFNFTITNTGVKPNVSGKIKTDEDGTKVLIGTDLIYNGKEQTLPGYDPDKMEIIDGPVSAKDVGTYNTIIGLKDGAEWDDSMKDYLDDDGNLHLEWSIVNADVSSTSGSENVNAPDWLKEILGDLSNNDSVPQWLKDSLNGTANANDVPDWYKQLLAGNPDSANIPSWFKALLPNSVSDSSTAPSWFKEWVLVKDNTSNGNGSNGNNAEGSDWLTWQVAVTVICLILAVIFLLKGVSNRSKEKQDTMEAEEAEESLEDKGDDNDDKDNKTEETNVHGLPALLALFGLTSTTWTIVAIVMAVLMVAALVYMIFTVNRKNKAHERRRRAKAKLAEEKRRKAEEKRKADEAEKAAAQDARDRAADERMQMLIMAMSGNHGGGGNGGSDRIIIASGLPSGATTNNVSDTREVIRTTVVDDETQRRVIENSQRIANLERLVFGNVTVNTYGNVATTTAVVADIAADTDDEDDDNENEDEEEWSDDEEDFYDVDASDDEQEDVPDDKKVNIPSNFRVRLKMSSDKCKVYYTELKNLLNSYKGLRFRMSGRVEKVNFHGEPIMYIGVIRRALKIWLALDPNAYDVEVYHHKDVSDKKRYEKVPMLVRVGSGRAVTRAKELIERLLSNNEIELKKRYADKPLQLLAYTLNRNALVKDKRPELLRQTIHVHDADVLTGADAERFIEFREKAQVEEANFATVSLDVLENNFLDGQKVNIDRLKKKGLIPEDSNGIRIIAGTRLTKPLYVVADEFSLDAVKMIVLTGGRVIRLAPEPSDKQ